MVGGGAVFDDTGQEDRLSCLLPDVAGYVVTPQARGADLDSSSRCPTPSTRSRSASTSTWTRSSPTRSSKVGFLTGNVAGHGHGRQAEPGGGRRRSAGTSSTDAVQRGRRGELDAVRPGACRATGSRASSTRASRRTWPSCSWRFDDIGYELDWVVADANHLDDKLIDGGGPRGQERLHRPAVVPPFLAEENPATQQYLDLFEKYLPDGKSKALPRLQVVLGLAPLRHSGQGVRRRPHPQVRLRQRQVDHGVDRWRPARPQRPEPTQGRRGAAWSPRPRRTASWCPTTSSPPTGSSAATPTTVVKLEGDYGRA